MSEQSESLSERELEILKLVATGVSNKEIASALQISPNTVKVHLRNIFSKIGVVSRTEATLFAIRTNLVHDDKPADVSEKTADDVLFAGSPIAMAGEVVTPTEQPAPSWGKHRLIIVGTLLVVAFVSLAVLVGVILRPKDAPVQATQIQSQIPSRWQTAIALPQPVSGAAAVTYGGKLYLIGGRSGENTLDAMTVFSPDNPKWESLRSKPSPVSNTQAAVIQDQIFVPGGRLADGSPSNRLEIYRFEDDSWEIGEPLPEALLGSAVAAVEGNLYVFGGWNGKEYVDSVYVYNGSTNKWSPGSPLPQARAYMAVSVIDGHVQLIGGEDQNGPTTEVWIFFPGRDDSGNQAYETGPDLPTPRTRASSVVLANITYLFGGGNNSTGNIPPLIKNQTDPGWTPIEEAASTPATLQAVLAAGNYIHIIGGATPTGDSAVHTVYQAIYTITIPFSTN
jgi:DNA-binding CsgD family transcriptional regulator